MALSSDPYGERWGLRFCVNYRKLNNVSKFDAYPMPRVEEVHENVGSATIFSTLELRKRILAGANGGETSREDSIHHFIRAF